MQISQNLVWLIALPLFSSVLLLLAGKRANSWGHLLATTVSASTFVIGVVEFFAMQSRAEEDRAVVQRLFTWISVGSFNVDASLLLDQLSICFVLLITGVGTLIHIYSISYMSHDLDRRRFFAYLNLFIAAMLLLVLGDSYLNLYVGWEGVGLASYLLIGFWNQKPAYATAAKKAFVANRVGDVGLSLAIMIAFATFGDVTFSGIKEQTEAASTAQLTAIGLMLLLAACGKSAQFPLQSWLGDAMAGPTPVSALIHAATMVTAGVYLITRASFIFDEAPIAQLMVIIVGGVTLLFGAIIGMAKDDIKKALAASTMSQIGYMILATGLGPIGYAFAIMHLLTHGFFKASMFLGAVMMLFLFILMLVGVDSSDSLEENIPGLRPVSIVAAISVSGLLVSLIGRATFGRPIYGLSAANAEGNAFGIAEQLFTKYVFAFEVVSALLITAALGAMVLGHSQKSKSKNSQRDLSIARFRKASLKDASGLPSAGVYALHNAVDVPALLPNGQAAPTSISSVLQARGDMIESATFEMKKNEEEEK